MSNITYRDRETGAVKQEKVYRGRLLKILYGTGPFSWLLALLLLPIVCSLPFLSKWYGKKQKSARSRKKILPFIRDFQINSEEFSRPIESFSSFNDFFIRKLRPETRPIDPREEVAVLPADGRYLVFPTLSSIKEFFVKGRPFSLARLLCDPLLLHQYQEGSMVIARLCPVDYHRFHFPCHCVPGPATLLHGPLYSVNPIALKRRLSILGENRRMITSLEGGRFGTIAYIEVGATCVGSIHQTYQSNIPHDKGGEKGYFEFGGSCLILLFQQGAIQFAPDLITASENRLETYGKMGTPLGTCKSGIPRSYAHERDSTFSHSR